jgi:hypothetical protein
LARKQSIDGSQPLNALYLEVAGGESSVAKALYPLLRESGYEVHFALTDRVQRYDLVIDNASRSAADVRALLVGLGGLTAHFVLISSYQVYPRAARLRPWHEDEIDVCIDQFQSLPTEVLACRSVERELRMLARGHFPVTILRPALLEAHDSAETISRWFVDRILEGGLIVLPEGDLPTYRHISAADLAAAIAAVAGREQSFDCALNVASQAVLGYWGHAAMLRDGLGHSLRFAYVPAWRWRAANLSLPLGERASSSFIEPSPILYQLGWRPGDTLEFVMALARQLAENRRPADFRTIRIERRVLDESEADLLYSPGLVSAPLPHHETRQWLLSGWAGQPASLSLERLENVQKFPLPMVKVRALTLTSTEERFLRGEYPQQGQRAIGHNALLEVMQSGDAGLAPGSLAIPLAILPCGDSACPICRSRLHAVLGIGCDGYGWGVCTTPPSHLIPIPKEMGVLALLADPLASLLAALGEPLTASKGPIWIAGRTFEAALVAWLAEDAGRPVRLVDRRTWPHDEFPVQAVDEALSQMHAGTIERPVLAVDFTGSTDVAWPLANALSEGSSMYVRRRPLGIPHGIHWHELPAAAPGRARLEEAVALLQRWTMFRDVGRRVGPAVPLDLYWDALLPSPFSLPWLDDTR